MQLQVKEMANPNSHIVLDEEVARTAEEHYVALEAELQVLRVRNKELRRGVTPLPSGAASPSTLGRERGGFPKQRLHNRQTQCTKCSWLHC